MKKPAVAIALFALVLSFGLLFATDTSGDLICTGVSNSREAYIPGYGEVCAYSGFGCTECWSSGTGNNCTTGPHHVCDPDKKQPFHQI